MRTVISQAMTKCENGARRSIMLADVKTAFLYGDARRSLYVELPPEDPLAASGRYVGKLQRAMFGTGHAPMIWQDHLRKTLFDMKFKESETRDILLRVLRFTRRFDVAKETSVERIWIANNADGRR